MCVRVTHSEQTNTRSPGKNHSSFTHSHKWNGISFTLSLVQLQALFVGQSREGMEKIIATTQSALSDDEPVDNTKPYTLEEYAIDYFRPPRARTLSGSLRAGIKRGGQIWAFARVRHLHVHIQTDIGCCTGPTQEATVEEAEQPS